jgi:hypothetical protein
MKRLIYIFIAFIFFAVDVRSQNAQPYELGIGLSFQKTEQLYWENGLAADYTSDFLVHKKIHLKFNYVTSRLGSAMIGNAVKQDNFVVGADWRFRSQKTFQLFAGLNTGFFHADMENAGFDILPHNSLLLSLEAGMSYRFKFPVTANLSVGYNLITGNGTTGPGTLFPVFYKLSVFYTIEKK